MDSVELDFPSEHFLSCLDMTTTQSSSSFDIDEFLVQTQTRNDALDRAQACTHAHACNPPGPDKTHTHTCIHVHTQIMSDDNSESADVKAKKRPMGNREAVRKYRERKKAKTASLEDEVVKLRALNQQLMKRVQNQVILEAEVSRLRCLLVDVRGRIEGEIGSFSLPKARKMWRSLSKKLLTLIRTVIFLARVMDSCNVQCNDQGLGDCELDDLQCLGNWSSCPNEVADCGPSYVNNVSTGNTSSGSKRNWACAATAS